MTRADLVKIGDALEAARATWEGVLLAQVAEKVADARVYAAKAITDELKRIEDGRKTVRSAAQSPEFAEAIGRLDGLHDWLAGPSAVSLNGQVRDAREALYRLAFALHKPLVPPELLVTPDPKPTRKAIGLVRGAAIHGYDPRNELAGPIGSATRALLATVATAGLSTVARREGADLLKGWQKRHTLAISQCVRSLLADSAEYCDGEARADLIHPKYREEPAAAGE